MPVGLWGDASGQRLFDEYFSFFPGIWRQGDWVTFHQDGSCVLSGRSDTTLNRGGVRLGTGEFYAVLEEMDEVADSLIVHIESEGDTNVLLLFVVLNERGVVDSHLITQKVLATLRRELSPRHVPDRVEVCPGIPRTLSGKKVELPVKRILEGADPTTVVSRESLANPTSLDWFESFTLSPTGPSGAPRDLR
jgi:acetoacetyl-CoA synthetase